MRLGSRSSNEFINILNEKNAKIQQKFLTKITELTRPVNVKVMLGDSTITEQSTFDPDKIREYYVSITKNLKNWNIQDISISNNEDLRRIFTKFEIAEGNYLISGHISLQYHVLLYYKPDNRVITCQKELSELVDLTQSKEQSIANESNQLVVNKLKDMGYDDPDEQKLFEILFENDELREKIYAEINASHDIDFKSLSQKKKLLLSELDSYLIETYQTSSVLIDDTRLISGEEGCLCTFDLEFIKKQTREGLFDARKIPEKIKISIINRLDEFYNLV